MFRSILFWLFLPCLAFAGDWRLLRFDGRDYVSLENIATFYGFSPETPGHSPLPADATPATYHTGLSNGHASISLRIGSREAVINGVRQWLSYPVREENGQVLLSRIDLAKTVDPMLRPEQIAKLKPVQTVVLDAGHGGHDRGAINAMGDEKTYTLDICRRIKPLLEAQGLRVVFTRERDVFVPLEVRPKKANAIPNAIFVAVHFNSANTDASGFEVFAMTPRGAPSTGDSTVSSRDFREEPGNSVDVASAALASSVYHAVLGHLPEPDRGLKRARFAVIRLATVPAILIEGGFLSNAAEARLINTPSWRQKLAQSIATGIMGYKGLSESHQTPTFMADYRKIETGG